MNQPATPILTILRPLALAAVLLTLGAGCATTDYVTGKRTQNMYTLADEIQLGRSAYLETRNTLQKTDTPINQDPARVALIREITTNIAAVAHITNLTYETTFVGDPDIVNAYAFPGGHMMVFEGLWNETNGLVQTVDELAAVIGHEIAHVNCRHSTEAMTRQMLPNLLLAGGMIWAEIEEKEDLQLLFGGLMVVHNGLVVTKYSRKDELEADRVGMFYMAQAGYDPAAAPRIVAAIESARDRGDSIGSVIACVCRGVPAGWGEPVFDKLTAQLARAMMSIPATRGFEVGAGFAAARMRGSEHNDPFTARPGGGIRPASNHCGGIQGGISNGEEIFFSVAFKPVSTISLPQSTAGFDGTPVTFEAKGRHDPCVLPRAVPVVEAMAALVLGDAFLHQQIQLMPRPAAARPENSP